MKATRFMRRPFFVRGFPVTEQNMEAVAQWCEGHVIETDEKRFIRVPVHNAKNIRQTEAHVGAWVLKSRYIGRVSFKVYTEDWLNKDFVEAPDDTDEEEVIPDGPPRAIARRGEVGEGTREIHRREDVGEQTQEIRSRRADFTIPTQTSPPGGLFLDGHQFDGHRR